MDASVRGPGGADHGCGQRHRLATAHRLAEERAAVVAGILEESQAAAVRAFDAVVLNVAEEADWDRALAHVSSVHGGLDVLVNNAGIHRRGSAAQTTRELWDEVMAVNLWCTFLGCRKAIPPMKERGGGSIVNLASIAAIRGVPGAIAYSTSKGGISTMTNALAVELVGDGIRVNCVCPGAVETPIIDEIVAEASDSHAMRTHLAAQHAMDRLASPDEVAAASPFLPATTPRS